MTVFEFAKHAAAVVLTLIALLMLWAAGSALAIFLMSLAIAAALHPQVEYLKGRRWPGALAAGALAGACLLVVAILGIVMGPPLVANLNLLENDISLAFTTFAEGSPDHWLVRMTKPATDATTTADMPNLSGLLVPLVGTASNLFQLSAMAGICFALAFYWTLDRARFERLWLSLVPVKRRVGAQRVWQSIEREVGAYLRSEIIQFLLAVVLLWLVFIVLDLRYAALVALVAGTLTLIPWLGTLFASAVVLVLTSPKLSDLGGDWVSPQGWMALASILVVLIVLEFVVEPRLFQRDRYNALWTALATILMAGTWGMWGLLFGPLVGYVLQILVRQVYPRLVQDQPRISSETTLYERLARLEARFAEQPDPPLELVSFKERLVGLVEQRDEMIVREA
jgi:putative permease